MTSSLLGGIQTPPLPLVIMSWLNNVITFGGYPDPLPPPQVMTSFMNSPLFTLFFFCNWFLHTWNELYTWSQSIISFVCPLIIGSKLTSLGCSYRWLPSKIHFPLPTSGLVGLACTNGTPWVAATRSRGQRVRCIAVTTFLTFLTMVFVRVRKRPF